MGDVSGFTSGIITHTSGDSKKCLFSVAHGLDLLTGAFYAGNFRE